MRGTVARVALAITAVVVALVLAGCAVGTTDLSTVVGESVARFWLGVWHGLIYPVTFLIPLFNKNVNIFEVHNNGGWYDFGFVMGVRHPAHDLRGPALAARRNSSKGGRS